MAEDRAMPQADGCCETLDPQVAEANQARELADLLERTFDGSGYRDLRLPRNITVGVIEAASKLLDLTHAYSRAEVTFNSSGQLVLRLVGCRMRNRCQDI